MRNGERITIIATDATFFGLLVFIRLWSTSTIGATHVCLADEQDHYKARANPRDSLIGSKHGVFVGIGFLTLSLQGDNEGVLSSELPVLKSLKNCFLFAIRRL